MGPPRLADHLFELEPKNLTADFNVLMLDSESEVPNERRANERRPFVRPIDFRIADGGGSGFSREISQTGIGTITQFEPEVGTYATLVIHLMNKSKMSIEAEVRWTRSFGSDWYLTGWKFRQ